MSTGPSLTETWEKDREEMLEIAAVLRKELELTEKQYKHALILLAAVYVGHSDTRISRFTGLSRGFIIPRKKKLLKLGMWFGDGLTNAEWLGKNGGIAFLCDILVLDGRLTKTFKPHEEIATE
jgi:hypothetical protein